MLRIPNLLPFSVYSVIGTVTLMPLLVLPAMVGILVDDAGLSEPFAGWVASANFSGSASVALLMAFRIHGIDLRRVASLALGVSVIGDAVSAFAAAESPYFLLLRLATGLASGAAHIAAITAFARFDNVERGYGLFITLQFIVSGFGLYLLPVHADALGVEGMYLIFSGLHVLALLLVRHLPGGAVDRVRIAGQRPERSILFAATALLAILGYGLFEAANTAQFTYIERFGVALGLSDRRIGLSLLIASLIGIPGAFVIVVTGRRYGLLGPLTLGMSMAVAGLLLLITVESYGAYFLASCCLGFAWAFCLPYIQVLMAAIDRRGSAIAAGSAVATVGGAAGPGLAAVILAGSAYRRVFLMSILIFAAAASSFLLSQRRPRPQPAEVHP
jgi:predicted MFS family arabinose efflux permease